MPGAPTAGASDPDLEQRTLRALGRLTHIDDPERVAFYRDLLVRDAAASQSRSSTNARRRLLTMLAWGLGSGASAEDSLDDVLRRALARGRGARGARPAARRDSTRARRTLAAPSVLPPEIPLTLHARYSRQEIVAALGSGDGVKPKVTQGGILWVPQAQSDVFFVDLHKAERDYSPTTMYRDYAINRELFHWESQSRQTPQQPTVQRYINHQRRAAAVSCSSSASARTSSSGRSRSRSSGPATYVDHRGERPVAFTWRLPAPMPEELFESRGASPRRRASASPSASSSVA